MRNLVAPFILTAFAACTPSVTNGPVVAPLNLTSAEAHLAADSVNSFAAELHATMPKEGNLFYSPASVAIALAMAEQGAAGPTKAEMDKVLHLSANAPTYAALLSRLSESKSPELAIANRNYFDKKLVIEPAFTHVAPSETVDFVHDAEGARGNINAWVSDRTRTRIPDLIGPGMLDKDTRFVITNAIYFKGTWAHAFEPKSTIEAPFHGATETKVSMMNEIVETGIGEHANAQVLDLAYKKGDGPEVSMVIVLPTQGHTLAEVEAAYVKEGLAPFASAASTTGNVEVSLPKMTTRSTLELAPALDAMGMKLAFTNDADFSGITHTEPLKIAKVIHKAFVDVNEEGTEAAAATAVVGVEATAIMMPHVFRADHPFMYFVRERASGVVLFAGRYAGA